MQKAIKILFGTIALLYLLGTSYQMYLFLDYQTHKEEITLQFCVNKDKPDMNCNGKCHLKEKLSEVHLQVQSENEHQTIPDYSIVKFDTFNETNYTVPTNLISEEDKENKTLSDNYYYLPNEEDSLPPENV